MELKPYEKYFLDIKEAVEYYGIGLKKVRRLAEDGMGRYAILCGNRYLIMRAKFEEFIESTMLASTPGNLGTKGDTHASSQMLRLVDGEVPEKELMLGMA